MPNTREIYDLLLVMVEDNRFFHVDGDEFSQESAERLIMQVANQMRRIPHVIKAEQQTYYASVHDLLVALQQKTGSQL